MKIINEFQILETLGQCLAIQKGYALIKYISQVVNYGVEDKPNLTYCDKHNIKCFDLMRKGGTFVAGAGDIAFGYVSKGVDSSVVDNMHDLFMDYLKSKKLNVTNDNNDVMIDGFKVFAWSSNYFPEYDATFSCCHFSINVDLELIKNICTKPMKKIPKGLSEYGITTEEIEHFVIDFANKELKE